MKATIVFTCDAWKSRDSMNLVGVFTNKKKYNTMLRSLFKEDTFEINVPLKEFLEMSVHDQDVNVNYLHIYEINLNIREI